MSDKQITDFYRNALGIKTNEKEIYLRAVTHKSYNNSTNNERLEFLGDAVLDSVVSHFLFNKFPTKKEGYLTQLRARIVSRQNLNELGKRIGLKELINSKLDKETKSIFGDALEALIGAIYIDKGYEITQDFVHQKLLSNHIDLETLINTETDFKSRVIEWCQKEKCEIKFVVVEIEQNSIKKYSTELLIDGLKKGVGLAPSKKKSEQIAAQEFYNTLN